MNPSKISVTILTGFLGSGKTTLLNHILHAAHGQRIAVIENEFGEAGIDNELLFQDSNEQIVEMNNGCLCCTVRDDLIRILGELAQKRSAGQLRFDRVLIETTGLADPSPVAQTFFFNQEVHAHYRLDGVVTMVDAKHAQGQLDQHREAQEQIGFADRLLISKIDLVNADELAALETRLRAINPRALLKHVPHGAANVEDVLNIRGFDITASLQIYPAYRQELSHTHNDSISSMVFRSERPFDPEEMDHFMRSLLHQYGTDLLRYKGILHLKDEPAQVVIQGVQITMGSSTGRLWKADEQRESVLVFIGRNLPRELLQKGLTSCLVD